MVDMQEIRCVNSLIRKGRLCKIIVLGFNCSHLFIPLHIYQVFSIVFLIGSGFWCH